MSMINTPAPAATPGAAPAATAPAPAQAPAPAAREATPGQTLRDIAADRTARRAGRARAQGGTAPGSAPDSPPSAPHVPSASPQAPGPEASAPAAAPPPEAEQPQEVDVDALRVKAARALHAAREHERRYREMEQRAKDLEQKLGSVDSDSPWKSGDLKAKIAYAQKHGLDLRAWTDHVLSSRGQGLEEPAQPGQSSPELEAMRAELEALKGQSQERQEREQRAQAEQLRAQELGVIERACASNDTWKLIADFGRTQVVYDRFYELQAQQGYAPRLPDVLDEVAEHLVGNTKKLLRHDAVRALAKADPELFSELRGFFAAEAEAASDAGPAPESRAQTPKRSARRPITNADTSDTTTRRAPQRATYADRKRAAVARLHSLRSS